jgi:hypothetical protein
MIEDILIVLSKVLLAPIRGHDLASFDDDYVSSLEEDRESLRAWFDSQPKVTSLGQFMKLMLRKDDFYKTHFGGLLNPILIFHLETNNCDLITNAKERAIVIFLHSIYHIIGDREGCCDCIRAFLIDLIVIDSLIEFDQKAQLLSFGIDFLKASKAFKMTSPELKDFAQFHFNWFLGTDTLVTPFGDDELLNKVVEIEIGDELGCAKVQAYLDSHFEGDSRKDYYKVILFSYADFIASIRNSTY